jgi:DnaK suppressor protein
MSTLDTTRYRQALEDERRRVQEALEASRREDHVALEEQIGEETAFDNHPADVATATFDRELAYSLDDSEERVLAAIDAALRRIDDGTYGTCLRCGKPISEERLDAMPYAELCIECARETERS